MNYIPLNVKTNYHLLSSLVDIKKLIKKCLTYNINCIGITDPNMYSVMDFYKECKNNNIKPIIGLELDINNYKIYLYAINYEGYQNLTKLVFLKQSSDIDIDVLKKHNQNLICILPFESKSYYEEYKDIFKNIYLSYSSLEERKELNKDAKLIFMNEVLELIKDNTYLKYLSLIKDGKKEDSLNDYIFKEDVFLMSNEEVLLISNNKDIKNMEEIYNLCNIEFKQNNLLLPKYSNDKKFNESEYLKALCKKGLSKRLDNIIPDIYIKRLQYELSVIDKMGFNDYFLVVWDFIKYSKQNNILTGPGRGSAAGSLVSYCLGITDIDPLKYNLLFERFLNPERITMPDIDIDFESIRRNEVVNYIINKYGMKKAMPIITFVTLGGRQAVRDVGRILDMKVSLLDEICKLVDPHETLKESIKKNEKLSNIIKRDNKVKSLFEIAYHLEGVKRQISTHAAGLVISDLELDAFIPTQKYDNYYITGISMEHLEELGLLKIDLLGLKNLTLIENVLRDINSKEPDFKLNNILLDDKETLMLFEKAYTEGVFQFESAGMKNFIKKLKPSSFEEIVAAIALFRPGPMDNIDSYIKRKKGIEKIDYIHPDLINILEPTYGIIVYQEQIMQIANVMANYSLGEADVLRRAMSKKKKEILEEEQSKFIDRSIKKGYTKEIASKVYNLILKFANYGFNRAHSVAYSLIGYRMAYLKAHYGEYFMSGLLTNVIGNESKTKDYIEECKANGINILKPDINDSEYNYKATSLGIRFSLAAIKNVGGITCKEIIKAREKGPFTDFINFVGRTYSKAINKKTIEALIDAGCFKTFGYNRQTLHYNLSLIINYADLIKDLDESLVEKPIIEVVKEYESSELTDREIKVFGFYLENHPVIKYNYLYKDIMKSINIKDNFDKVVTSIINIDKLNEVTTKNNEKMLFIAGSDETGPIDIVLFPKTYLKYNDLKRGSIIHTTGRVEKRMSRYQLVVTELEILS
ncbi:MAG: DNA polymerase III subunit alpha [Bacilli bacterium]|nr:DNA polymerase III subunit alpha [Bacilli bacterium]